MGSKIATTNLALSSTLVLLFFLLLVGPASSDLNQDKAECTDKLIALGNCLPFVSGEAKAPTMDCCTGIKEVVSKSKRCLCILVKDHDDPNLGLNINVTLALQLPKDCKAPTNISECVDLLHLAPKSQEAKIFEGYEKALEKNSSSTPVPRASGATVGGAGKGTNTSAQVKSGGGWGRTWLVTEVLCWVLPVVFISHFFFLV